MNKIILAILGAIILGILVMVVMAGWRTVPVGTRGVLLTMGKASAEPLPPGLHIITPFFQNIDLMNVQTQISSTVADAASSDLQDVSTTVAINYHVNPSDAVTVYSNLGQGYADKVIAPAENKVLTADSPGLTAFLKLYLSGCENKSNGPTGR